MCAAKMNRNTKTNVSKQAAVWTLGNTPATGFWTHNVGNQKVIFMDHQTLAVTDFQEFVIGMMKVVTTTIIGDLDLQPADQRNTESHLTLREAGEGTNQGHQCQEVCAQSA